MSTLLPSSAAPVSGGQGRRTTNCERLSHTVPVFGLHAMARATRLSRDESSTPTTALPHLRRASAGFVVTLPGPRATQAAGLSAFQFPTSFCASRQEATATFDAGRPERSPSESASVSCDDEHPMIGVEVTLDKRRSSLLVQDLSALRRVQTNELESLPLESLLRRRSTAVPLLPDHVDPQPLMEVQDHQTTEIEDSTFSIASDSTARQWSSVIASADQFRFAPFSSSPQRLVAHATDDEYPASLMLWRHAVSRSLAARAALEDITKGPELLCDVTPISPRPKNGVQKSTARKPDAVLLDEHRSAMSNIRERMERNPSLALEHRLLIKASESQCARGRLKALDAAHEMRRLARWKVRIEQSILQQVAEEAHCRIEIARDEASHWTRLRRAAESEHLSLQTHVLAFRERTAREALRSDEMSTRMSLCELEADHRRRSLLRQACREAVAASIRAEREQRLVVTKGEEEGRRGLIRVEHTERHSVLLVELARDEARERALVEQFFAERTEELSLQMSAAWRACKERECNRLAQEAFVRGAAELIASESANRQLLHTTWDSAWHEISSGGAALAHAILEREAVVKREHDTRADILNNVAVENDVLGMLWRTSVVEADQRAFLRGEEEIRRLLQRDAVECHEQLSLLEAKGRAEAMRREEDRRKSEQEAHLQRHVREQAQLAASAYALVQSLRDEEAQALQSILRQRSEEREDLLRREQEAAAARAFRQRALSSAPFLGFSLAEKVAPASAAEKRLVHDAQIANLAVDSLVIGGPAHAQGVQLNDIIVSVGGGVKPTSLTAVRQAIASGAKVGQTFEVIVKRKKAAAVSGSLDDTGRSLAEVDFRRLLEEDDAMSVASEEAGSQLDHPNSVRHAYETLVFHVPVKTVLPEFSSLSDLFFDVTKAQRVERENPTPGYTTRTRRAFTEKLGASPYLSPQQPPRPSVSPSAKSPGSLPNPQGRPNSGTATATPTAPSTSDLRSVSPHREPAPLSRLQTARPTELSGKRATGPVHDKS